MRFKVDCPQHGQVMAEGDTTIQAGVVLIIGSCGCTRSVGKSAPGDAYCTEPGHGSQDIIYSDQCDCERHSFAWLACGCEGVLWHMRSASVFIRKAGQLV